MWDYITRKQPVWHPKTLSYVSWISQLQLISSFFSFPHKLSVDSEEQVWQKLWITKLESTVIEPLQTRPSRKGKGFLILQKFMAVHLPPVWVWKSKDLGWCLLTDSHKPATDNNVHPQEKQSSLPQPGGLLLPSLLILLSLALLCSPLIRVLSRQQWQRRRDRDGSDTSCRAGTGFAGEEWGAGNLSGTDGEGGGGKDKDPVNSVFCNYANSLTPLKNIEK